MTPDVNEFVGLPYDKENFNCWHLFRRVLSGAYGVELPDTPDPSRLPLYEKLDRPRDGAAMLMYSHGNHAPEHIGVCIGSTQVLHCHGSAPVSMINYISSCRALFWKVEFYAVNHRTS